MANERWLIDVNEFRKLFWSKLQNLKFIGPMDVEHIILNTPTVDAVEVVHGEAVHIPANFDSDDVLIRMDRICSECGALMTQMDNYCPNCGAKMDKKDG